MPLDSLAEALIRPVSEFVLQPIAECVAHVAGYLTGVVIVPVATLGHMFVKHPKGEFDLPPGRNWARTPNGRIVLSEDWGTLAGMFTWLLIGAAALLVYCTSGP
ncbi:hypothetical protein SAMN05216567_103483 [Variovorax sp. OK605]|uniref:hypothetical protein n=1 Tax=Variovorax sp. OK605 TaxID=1855317 RepID=UPI0008E7A5C1|nr:hypothetical protein [Variovorax sp. OK605]SFO95612.1 hypothetical protein SAMN05216567_103483 [Variovorax sp. OK605]